MTPLARLLQRLPLPRDAAVNLAVFRIVVAASFLTTGEVHDARAWAGLPPELAFTPRGWGWALALFPPGVAAASAAHAVLVVAATLALLGLHARLAFAGVTLAALYLLALPLRNGLPYHDQHLVWFAALCAASPCADALSLGRWLRRRRAPRREAASWPSSPPRSAAYGVPLRAAWALIGVIFFFPGLWKLRSAGVGWISGDYLRDHLFWKWAISPGFEPLFRIDRHPALIHAAAAAVVAFELSFLFLVWHPWSRRLAVASALAFHAGARWLMGIDFSGLWLTYVAFVDWDALGRRWRQRRRRTPDPDQAPLDRGGVAPGGVAPALIMAVLLLTGAIEAGARGATVGWPFACYPTFQDRAPTTIPMLAMAGVRRDGGDEVIFDPTASLDPGQAARQRVMDTRLVTTARTPGGPARFAERWRQQRTRTDPSGAGGPELRAVRFYASMASTAPDQRDLPPRRGALLYELPLE